MDGKKFAKILTGIALIVFGFITRNMALESYNRNAEIFEWLGLLMIVFGAVDVIVAVAQKSENSNTAAPKSNQQESSMFIKCPNCGEENGTNNEYCYKCKTFLNQKHTSPEFSNSWICPKCGKINQNYVGTCGCGKGKPK